MSEEATLHGVLGLLAGTALLLWTVLAVVLHISPAASSRFALANLLLALGIYGSAQRGAADDWMAWPAADLLVLTAFAVVRSGLCRLFKRRWPWRQDAALLLTALLCYALLTPGPSSVRFYTALFSFCAALLCASLAWEVWDASARAFRRSAAVVLSSPFAAAALVMLLRIAPLEGQDPQAPLDPVASLWAFVALTLLLNVSLGVCVMARLLQVMQERASRDPLTGLLNRRAFADRLEQELARVQRQGSGSGFALLLIDLDHFKRLNDERGHAAGDMALRHAAELFRKGLRQMDSLGRHGGEEFVALLPATPQAAALQLAERMRRQLAETTLQHGGLPMRLSASFGVVHSSQLERELNAAALLARADAALYAAKAAGRNCVRAAE
jgi:diguanylate cyclase (GGDEF)-like protein